jgi:hypothetical protein
MDFSIPPSLLMVKNFDSRVGTDSREEVKRISSPFGVQPVTISGLGCQVSRVGCPPSVGIRYTSVFPSY